MIVKSAFRIWFTTSVHRFRTSSLGMARFTMPVICMSTISSPAATNPSHTSIARFAGFLHQLTA
jgi:hypothetical protein